ncbi:cellulase family glycosylhydrolase [Patulibacter medicamentivorans]|uniref:cellulase family glycosylhydrolase n=1 Tax=Patulibacter medicamentivorans TaxID=1097667 RepID=UPI0002EA2E1F|nr:cellulase family glycosylhydrolase [Patulibacter medicamentivorans]
MRRLIPLTAALLVLLSTASASANTRLESTFQDDPRIVYGSDAVRKKTLDEAQALGVQRIRLTAFWYLVAPSPDQASKPTGFDASDPNAYPAANWARYDTVIKEIRDRGMQVNLNPTAPGPLWAMSGSFDERLADRTNPDPAEFGAFVAALGKRYSGSFVPAGQSAAQPRIDYWSIWNEPNQGAWLSPQWSSTATTAVEQSPPLYRKLVDASWTALGATGHGGDTILVGETAPKGQHKLSDLNSRGTPMDAMRFLRRVYCLNDSLGFLTGADASKVDCPATPNPAEFTAQHPALFQMTGYAHHPYELVRSPTTRPDYPDDWVTTANLGTLSDQLERIMARYKVKRSSIPLYLTEYGYQTDPPDSITGVSLNQQAAWINQAEYIAWRNRYVRTLAQFLLYDDGPVAGATGDAKWSTFQTGLRFGPGSGKDGKAKPAYDAYRLPFFLPSRRAAKSGNLKIWGRVRPGGGSGPRAVELQLRDARGRYKRFKSFKTSKYGFVSKTVRVRRASALRLAWKSGSKTFYSRGVSFKLSR